ncbi:MAG TPA: phosphatase PAP2 family protein [Vicinamibacteria bacterium]|nr:phosphatase PAP2 family protein [Vicinamibacteria bacterium]
MPAGGAALASLADADAVTLGDRPPIDSAKRLDRSLDDGRRTLSQFAPNLGRNVVGVFARENLRPLLAGAAFTGIATRLDGGTARALRGRAEDLGELGRQAGTASTIGPLALGLFVTGRAASDPRFRGLTYDIAQATIVTGLYTEIFKRAASRERPDGSDTRSFPSGHTSNAFAWAALAQHHYGTRIGVPAYAVAGLVGLSRIERDKHHLSDVVGGAALGFIVGRTVAREDGEPVRRERRVSFVPMTDANGAGLGAGVHVAF